MGIYYRCVFPWLLDFIMSREVLTEQRKLVIPGSSGKVLEIGCGTGRNLTLYPATVSQLVVVEPNQKLTQKAEKRYAGLQRPFEILPADAGTTLPLQDNTFDT